MTDNQHRSDRPDQKGQTVQILNILDVLTQTEAKAALAAIDAKRADDREWATEVILNHTAQNPADLAISFDFARLRDKLDRSGCTWRIVPDLSIYVELDEDVANWAGYGETVHLRTTAQIRDLSDCIGEIGAMLADRDNPAGVLASLRELGVIGASPTDRDGA